MATDPSSSAGTLVKDPTTGAFTLAPGMGSNPTGATATPATGNADPYTLFNTNLASILTQIQAASAPAANKLGAASDALTTEGIGAAGGYNAAATPAANLQDQSGTFGAFAPAITDVNTQLSNANTAVGNLGTEVSGLETAYKPQAISPGDSLVTPGGTIVLNGTTYSVQVDPTTGSLSAVPQNSLTAPGSGTGSGAGGSTSGGKSSTVGGVDFSGTSVGMGAYATDPNYTQEISSLYNTVSGLGVAGNSSTLDQYIQNNAKGSPVTGSMIINAANAYGVDPAILTTVLLHESDFGTAGAAVKTMNPGNVGNTGASTQSYNSWQQGVMATAKNLAARMPSGSSAAPASGALANGTSGSAASSNVGASFNSQTAASVSALPPQMQQYVQAGLAGVGYVDDDRVPQNMKTAVANAAAQAGIPYLTSADVAAVQSLTQVQQNMQLMSNAASKTLGSGIAGGIGNILATGLNDATFGDALPNYSQFNSYATAAINTLKGLAGSGGGFRITQSEIDTAQANVPESTDTLAHAEKKMQVLQGLVYTTLAKIFPDAPVAVTDPDGTTGTVPAKNFAAAVQAGAQAVLGSSL